MVADYTKCELRDEGSQAFKHFFGLFVYWLLYTTHIKHMLAIVPMNTTFTKLTNLVVIVDRTLVESATVSFEDLVILHR